MKGFHTPGAKTSHTGRINLAPNTKTLAVLGDMGTWKSCLNVRSFKVCFQQQLQQQGRMEKKLQTHVTADITWTVVKVACHAVPKCSFLSCEV